MSACPSCGGTVRSAVAAGYWKCGTEVLVGMVGRGGGQQPVYRPCGNRYQDGLVATGSVPQCSCKMFAVGTCHSCDQPICGVHGGLRQGVFLCGSCWREADGADQVEVQHRQAEAAQQARLTAEREAARAAAYEALPPMGTAQIAAWLRGSSSKEPDDARLPSRLVGTQLTAVLARLPPTTSVVTRAWGRNRLVTLNLSRRPAWRVGTARYYSGGIHGYGASTRFLPAVLFADGDTAVVEKGGNDGAWYLRDGSPRAEVWTGDRAATNAFRLALGRGMVVPGPASHPD